MRSGTNLLGFALMCAVAFSGSGRAATAATASDTFIGSIDIAKAPHAPPIDGTLSDPAWQAATVVHLTFNHRELKAADEATTVYLMADSDFVYVGVDAKQSVPVRATQHTNMAGVGTDDETQIDFWPNGTSGFLYRFLSTPNGTHYQYSTENNSFEPDWLSAGRTLPDGYTVNMRVPLRAMHSTGANRWRIQLIRYVAQTATPYIWSYGPNQRGWNDVNYAGVATGLPRVTAFTSPPRVGIYGLGASAGKSGGSAIRTGADFSVPVMPGTSLVGAINPDFSDVEVDQQTIAPTAFARSFAEVRPFFTQGANFYEYGGATCIACPGVELQTATIPTPRDGFAIEGQRGAFSYAAFDALGSGRNDAAFAFNYTSPDQKNAIGLQRTAVEAGGLRDTVAGVQVQHDNLSNLLEYARFADDSGTRVLDTAQAQRLEAGMRLYSPTSSVSVVMRKLGAYFNPFDGLITRPDSAGYDINAAKQFVFSRLARFTELDVSTNLDRYHDRTGALAQSDTSVNVALTTRTLFTLQGSAGSSYVMLAPGDFSPVSQQGAQLSYHLNSSTPAFVSFNTGRFGPGKLNSWARSATLRAGPRGVLTAEADDTDQRTDDNRRFTQWLERLSYAYQSGPKTSLAFGVRRIIGTSPQLVALPTFRDNWNVSAAYHRTFAGGELYVVYGDAAAVSSTSQTVVKWIRYIGAGKGS